MCRQVWLLVPSLLLAGTLNGQTVPEPTAVPTSLLAKQIIYQIAQRPPLPEVDLDYAALDQAVNTIKPNPVHRFPVYPEPIHSAKFQIFEDGLPRVRPPQAPAR